MRWLECKLYGRTWRDPAEDGPEVRIIRNEKAAQLCDFLEKVFGLINPRSLVKSHVSNLDR